MASSHWAEVYPVRVTGNLTDIIMRGKYKKKGTGSVSCKLGIAYRLECDGIKRK